jgi:uncharacterized protein (TIGR02246 family)
MNTTAELNAFGTRYTAAWCSQRAVDVASFFAKDGSLQINDGAPSVGRAAIAAAAQEFMTGFPDMIVRMDGITLDADRVVWRWTMTGTHSGPGGTGNRVSISGYETMTLSDGGLIEECRGVFDEVDYNRQLAGA